MKSKVFSGMILIILLTSMLYAMSNLGRMVKGGSNGGFSSDLNSPNYGAHDQIAQHALDWLPNEEKQYILDNLATYLYGTEFHKLFKFFMGLIIC